MAHVGSTMKLGGFAIPSLPMPLAVRSTRLVLLRVHLLGQAATAQCGPQRDCGLGIPNLTSNRDGSEAA